MKRRLDPRLKLARIPHPNLPPGSWPGDDHNGAFLVRGPERRSLVILASDGGGWDHVSVSIDDSHDTPTWAEMCFAKSLFFEPEETVLQYHPPRSRYINHFEGCLHLWRPQTAEVPMPPLVLV